MVIVKASHINPRLMMPCPAIIPTLSYLTLPYQDCQLRESSLFPIRSPHHSLATDLDKSS